MREKNSTRWSRRALLAQGGAALLASALPARLLRAADTLRFEKDPFTLGIASGYPGPDTVVLWTRLALAPLEPGGGMPRDAVIPVTWEVATDERMKTIVQSGTWYATPDWAHSVHAEPTGLEAGRDYWYRFRAGGVASQIGRTRTAPAPDAQNARMRIAVASCQQYEHGYYVGYRHMLEDDLDVIVHVGDYIYEASWGDNRIRSHATPDAVTLDDYRARYALYKGESELKQAHARYPWLFTWDDHEVENDYAGASQPQDEPAAWFLARRAAAYRACYEHMPLPRRALPFGPDMHIYTQRTFGQLARIALLDSRQYRSSLACTSPGRRGSRTVSCPELNDPTRTKLGFTQEGWVAGVMRSSRARWNLFAQGTVMAYLDETTGAGESFFNDGWSGYAAARTRFIDALADSRVANPVVLGGDIHSFLVAKEHKVPNDSSTPVIASEFIATSITSQGVQQKSLDARRAENPHVLFANTEKRGYLRLDVTKERLAADLVASDSVTDRKAGRSVQASFVVEAGKPGPVTA